MTVGELRERIEELAADDDSEIIFYHSQEHEVIQIDTIEKGVFDPARYSFTNTDCPDDHVGVPCVALFV